MAKEWDADEALESLKLEAQVHDSENDAQTAERLLRESSPRVALSIVHLALHSTNEKVRLDAGKYVMDRTLGRIMDAKPAGLDDPFDRIASVLATPAGDVTHASQGSN